MGSFLYKNEKELVTIEFWLKRLLLDVSEETIVTLKTNHVSYVNLVYQPQHFVHSQNSDLDKINVILLN